MDGVVRVEGFDIEFLNYKGPGGMTEFFRDMVTELSYDIGEQAFAHYLIAKDQGKPLTAIPVFPSRFFPHFGVSVATRAGVRGPKDLVGKRVAAPDWGFNPAVWMRGILAHQYDVPIEKITWVVNSDEPLFRGLPYPRSKRFQIEKVRVADDGSHGFLPLMESGGVDAVFLAAGGIDPTGASKKMFDDPYPEVEKYVAQTGVFPINTLITLRESVVEAFPELPAALVRAWEKARALYVKETEEGKDADHMGIEVRRLRAMGVFPQAYGVGPHRMAIRMMIEYCYEQGLIRTLFEPEDLFVGERA